MTERREPLPSWNMVVPGWPQDLSSEPSADSQSLVEQLSLAILLATGAGLVLEALTYFPFVGFVGWLVLAPLAAGGLGTTVAGDQIAVVVRSRIQVGRHIRRAV